MLLYRISKSIYAKTITASGKAGRWNSNGNFVIYCASSLSLACLEIVVHTSGKSLIQQNFSSITIEVPDDLLITPVEIKDLPEDWKNVDQIVTTKKLGDEWYNKQETMLLKFPSAIIDKESNYLINTKHPDFNKVSIAEVGNFMFDKRLKS